MEKDNLIELKAEVLKALGHPTRLAIVEMLAEGERCVCEINARIAADSSTISKHLSILKKAGILNDRKQGLNVYYRLEVTCVMKFINCITSVIESRARKELAAVKGK
jgi:DNA-binding transcriptional ArsR family regulator